MHTVVIKRELLDANPWLAATLLTAFSEAKRLATNELTQTSALPISLPFLVEHAYETMDLMGEDFWPYGVEENRKTLETFVRYMHTQGLIQEPMPIESLFAPGTDRSFRV
jgi:4,5-dihydroxyphthalate decarboxylase